MSRMDKLKHKIQDMYDQSDPPIFFFSRNITIWQMAAIPINTLLVFPFSEAVIWSRYIPPPSLLYVLYAGDWLNKMGLIVIDELVHDVCVCVCLVVVCPSWRLGRSWGKRSADFQHQLIVQQRQEILPN